MELYFLKSDFSLLEGPVDSFTSAVWEEKYCECGTFTLHLPRSFAKICKKAAYVRTEFDGSGRCRCGRITYIVTDAVRQSDCEVGGTLLEGLLGDRIIYGRGESVGGIMSVLEKNLHSLPIEIDADSFLSVETGNISLSWSWDRLSDWLYAVLRTVGASFSVTLEKGHETPVFRIFKGRDLSNSGDGQAVFSSSYGNIFSLELESDCGKQKNFAYIEGSDGTVISVDKSGGNDIREIYKKSADINPQKYSSESEYHAALRQKGEEILAKFPAVLNISAQSEALAPPVYGRDYSLGDICSVFDDETEICSSLRLTAIDTVCENGDVIIYPYFGETIKFRDFLGEQAI